jgi:hypothetical protein
MRGARWVQVAWSASHVSPLARWLLASMGRHAVDGDQVTASIRDLAEWSGISRPTISQAVKELAECSLVTAWPAGKKFTFKLLRATGENFDQSGIATGENFDHNAVSGPSRAPTRTRDIIISLDNNSYNNISSVVDNSYVGDKEKTKEKTKENNALEIAKNSGAGKFRVIEAISPPAETIIPAVAMAQPAHPAISPFVAPAFATVTLTGGIGSLLPSLTPVAPRPSPEVAPVVPEPPATAPARKKPAAKKLSPAEAIPEFLPRDWIEPYHRARRQAGLHIPGVREMDARWEDFRAYWTAPENAAKARQRFDWRMTWVKSAKLGWKDAEFAGLREEDERAKRCINYQIAEEEAARAAGIDPDLLDEYGNYDPGKALLKRAAEDPAFQAIVDEIDRLAAESRQRVLECEFEDIDLDGDFARSLD